MKFEILTPTGFQSFEGVHRSIRSSIKVIHSNGVLCATKEHRLIVDGKEIEISKLKPKMKIGNGSSVVSISLDVQRYVYDPINVNNGNVYCHDKEFISHNCEFLGSSGSLIDGNTLKRLTHKTPLELLVSNKFKMYAHPQKDRIYAMTVDCSEGLGQDFHVATVFDITKMPYRVVGVYRDNSVSSLILPEILIGLGNLYNQAHMLIELNSDGKQVANDIQYDYDYENLMYVAQDAKNGQVLMGKGVQQPGIKTSKTTKKVGCSTLKELLENNKLIVEDFDAISELSRFVRVKDSYAAEEGTTDDVVMTLVLFAWMTKQAYFNSLNDVDIRKEMYAQQMQEIEDSILSFISPDYEQEAYIEPVIIDKSGIRWDVVMREED